MKKFLKISLLISLFSCERVRDYQCVCYYNKNTDSVKYELYNVKNKKSLAESYCYSLTNTYLNDSTHYCEISE